MSQWIFRLIGISALGMVALAITPDGKAKKAVKLVCGLVVVLTALSGISNFDYSLYSSSLADYKKEAERIIADSTDEKTSEERKYIEEASESYILDKAEAFGINCADAKVTVKWSSDGYWYPDKAEIYVKSGLDGIERLADSIEGELGISKDNQIWSDASER